MKKFLKRLLIFILIIVLLLGIAFGLYVFKIYKEIQSQVIEDNQTSQQENIARQIAKITQGDGSNYWSGTTSPAVTIVEFSDFGCPLCAQSFPAIRELSVKYKDDIKIIYRDFPLNEFSINLALGARCAGEQGSFWLMHDKLFQNQGNINTNQDILNLAKSIGLQNIDQFNTCLNSDKYKPYIQKDFDDAVNLGVKGTPTWFVNGNKIEGNLPIQAWEEIINELFNK